MTQLTVDVFSADGEPIRNAVAIDIDLTDGKCIGRLQMSVKHSKISPMLQQQSTYIMKDQRIGHRKEFSVVITSEQTIKNDQGWFVIYDFSGDKL
jgi:hypothetical protein